MSASKRPSTSSLRRFITSRPFVTVAELRRRFGLDEPDAMALLRRNGTTAWIGLPDREAGKLQELWDRGELGVELSVEVRAPVVVGVYPMRIARYVMEGNGFGTGNGHPGGNGYVSGQRTDNDQPRETPPTGPAAATQAENAAATQAENGVRPSANGVTTNVAPARQHPHAPRPMSGAPSYGSGNQPPGGSARA